MLGVALAGLSMLTTSCNDGKSYADLLNDEAKAVNTFLADQNVILDLPKDNDFIIGEDAPFTVLTRKVMCICRCSAKVILR